MTNFSDMTNPELDKAVAELMGWKVVDMTDMYNGVFYVEDSELDRVVVCAIKDFHPSTDRSQSLDVVDKMIADGWTMYGDLNKYGIGVKFMKGNIELDEVYNNKSIPRAICIAALVAKESEE